MHLWKEFNVPLISPKVSVNGTVRFPALLSVFGGPGKNAVNHM